MATDAETAPAPPVVGRPREFLAVVMFSSAEEAEDALDYLQHRWPGNGRLSYASRSVHRPVIVLPGDPIPAGPREDVPEAADVTDGFSTFGLVVSGRDGDIRELVDRIYETVRDRTLRIRSKRLCRQGRLTLAFEPAAPSLRPPSTAPHGSEPTGPTSGERLP
jgi:hypothetical protein